MGSVGKRWQWRNETVVNDGYEESKVWRWCAQCQRCYRRGEHRRMDITGKQRNTRGIGLDMCPYEDCGGVVCVDGFKWVQIRSFHPVYPVIPRRGIVYRHEVVDGVG